jgi:outer membrane protein assembly factor BamB
MKTVVKNRIQRVPLLLAATIITLGTARIANAQKPNTPAYGTIFVATSPQINPNAPTGVVAIDPKTGVQSVLSSGGLFALPTGLQEIFNETLYVCDQNSQTSGAVIEVNPRTGAQTLIATGGYIAGPEAMQYMNGKLFVADAPLAVGSSAQANVVEINPHTGKQTLITQGGGLLLPVGLTPGPDNTIFVSDAIANSIYQVDISTGAQTLVTTGNLLNLVDSLVRVLGSKLLVTDFGGNSLISVDLKTGNQTVFAQGGLLAATSVIVITRVKGTEWDRDVRMILDEFATSSNPAAIIEIKPWGTQRTISQGGLLDQTYGLVVYHHNAEWHPK